MRAWNNHPALPPLLYRARVEPAQIHHLCCLTEAHDGLAVVRTKDDKLGIVEFWVSPLMQPVFEEYVRALADEIGITIAPPREHTGDSYDNDTPGDPGSN